MMNHFKNLYMKRIEAVFKYEMLDKTPNLETYGIYWSIQKMTASGKN